MMGRNKGVVGKSSDAVSSTLGDIRTRIRVGAATGAALAALSALGGKAAEAAQSASGGSGWLRGASTAGQTVDAARKKVGGDGLMGTPGQLFQMLSKNVTSSVQEIQIDPNDVPRLLRGLTLIATGLGTLFAPGSALDVSKVDTDGRELAEQARVGIDTATQVTQQRIKDLVDLTKDTLSSLSEALTQSIEEFEKSAERALDDTESRLLSTTDEVSTQAKQAVPAQKGSGGTMRWLLFGTLAGGVAAYLMSPLSGEVGERINNLRRDLGLGGGGDDSQYWPNASQDTATTDAGMPGGTASDVTGGDQPSAGFGKTETWRDSDNAKESSDKS